MLLNIIFRSFTVIAKGLKITIFLAGDLEIYELIKMCTDNNFNVDYLFTEIFFIRSILERFKHNVLRYKSTTTYN